MAAPVTPEKLLSILRDTIIGTVRRDGPDLSARQFGVFLICYIEEGPHTVRGLAARLEVSKPAITRSLDRLAELSLARRAPDPRDRRSVLVQRTRKGLDFLTDVRGLLASASRAPEPKPMPAAKLEPEPKVTAKKPGKKAAAAAAKPAKPAKKAAPKVAAARGRRRAA